jgi:8-oxo-dGTP diphosphatase
MATPRVAAAVLITDERGDVLLVKPTYKEGWDLPGGYVEPGESPLAAVHREIGEELGLDWPVGALLVVDWAPHPAEGDKLLFIFDGGSVSAMPPMTFQSDEISESKFWPLSDSESVLPPRLYRRVAAAACRDPATTYLEHGQPLP